MSVFITSMVGDGFPDIVCGWKGETHLFEVKDPAKSPSRRTLTDDERKFHDGWKGSAHVVETIDDVLKIINKKHENRLEKVDQSTDR